MVWTTSVAFFQVALVVGYLSAHLLAARLPARAGAALHVAVLAAVRQFGGVSAAEIDEGICASAWVVLARAARDLEVLGHDAR